MANSTVQPVRMRANENPSPLDFASIKNLFCALPDADQVRFLAALYDEIRFDADAFHDALRDMAEEVSGFRASDDYSDAIRADDIYPDGVHTSAARDLYRSDRDRRLNGIVAYVVRRAAA